MYLMTQDFVKAHNDYRREELRRLWSKPGRFRLRLGGTRSRRKA